MKVRKVSVREFQRDFYKHVKRLPVAVINKRTGRVVFIIVPPEKGGELYEL